MYFTSLSYSAWIVVLFIAGFLLSCSFSKSVLESAPGQWKWNAAGTQFYVSSRSSCMKVEGIYCRLQLTFSLNSAVLFSAEQIFLFHHHELVHTQPFLDKHFLVSRDTPLALATLCYCSVLCIFEVGTLLYLECHVAGCGVWIETANA